MREQDAKRLANILPAFALALSDKIQEVMQGQHARSQMSLASLIQLHMEPGLSIEQLRRLIGLSHSGTVRVVDQLEQEGLLVRERSASGDARVSRLVLTTQGRAEAESISSGRMALAARLLAELNGDEAAVLEKAISKMTKFVVRTGHDQDIVCRFCDLNACPQDRCPVNCF